MKQKHQAPVLELVSNMSTCFWTFSSENCRCCGRDACQFWTMTISASLGYRQKKTLALSICLHSRRAFCRAGPSFFTVNKGSLVSIVEYGRLMNTDR